MSIDLDVRTIPHEHQRYATVGDYVDDSFRRVHITVSCMRNWRYELLVAVHEMVEYYLCKEAKIKMEDIDAFDKTYELQRLPDDDSEPGDSVLAPYHEQHVAATRIEKFIAAELGVNWTTYDKVVNNL